MQSARHPARQVLRMMHGDDERHTALHQALQQALHRRSLDGIETRQRLVQQQNSRIRRHGSCDERAAQLPVGQLARAPARDTAQFEECQPIERALHVGCRHRRRQADARMAPARDQAASGRRPMRSRFAVPARRSPRAASTQRSACRRDSRRARLSRPAQAPNRRTGVSENWIFRRRLRRKRPNARLAAAAN